MLRSHHLLFRLNRYRRTSGLTWNQISKLAKVQHQTIPNLRYNHFWRNRTGKKLERFLDAVEERQEKAGTALGWFAFGVVLSCCLFMVSCGGQTPDNEFVFVDSMEPARVTILEEEATVLFDSPSGQRCAVWEDEDMILHVFADRPGCDSVLRIHSEI